MSFYLQKRVLFKIISTLYLKVLIIFKTLAFFYKVSYIITPQNIINYLFLCEKRGENNNGKT
jgi:hypothetical protein